MTNFKKAETYCKLLDDAGFKPNVIYSGVTVSNFQKTLSPSMKKWTEFIDKRLAKISRYDLDDNETMMFATLISLELDAK